MKLMQRKSCPIICKGFDKKLKVCKFGIEITIRSDLFQKETKVPKAPCYGPYSEAEYDQALQFINRGE